MEWSYNMAGRGLVALGYNRAVAGPRRKGKRASRAAALTAIEALERRALLSAAGPQPVAYGPDGFISLVAVPPPLQVSAAATVSDAPSATPQTHLTILPTFDSSITNDPSAATIEATINSAIQIYETDFADPITVKILFQEMTTGVGRSGTSGNIVSYSQYRSALAARATTAADASAVASLPVSSNNPVNGAQTITVSTANWRALNADPTVPSGNDGTVELNTGVCNLSRASTDPRKYDLEAVTCHEIDEVLGFSSALTGLANGAAAPTSFAEPLDLFRYSQAGIRSFNTNGSSFAYFSIDGGATDLATFNQSSGGDFSDWGVVGGWTGARVQDAFLTAGVAPNPGVELTELDVLGYTPVPGQLFDGGFESPAVGSGFESNPSTAPWHFTGSAGISANGSTFTALNPSAPEGAQVAFIEQGGAISQSLSMSAGTYAISFDAAQRVQSQSGLEDFQVLVDGSNVGTFTPSAGGQYAPYQTGPFTVTAGNHAIQFVGLDSAGGDNVAFLDGVQVGASQVVVGSGTASFVRSDSSTGGTWSGVYGGEGYTAFGGATNLPAYAALSTMNASQFTWAASTADPRALQAAPGSTNRLAACDFAQDNFTIDLNLTDGQAHRVALYAVNWDSQSYRNETITLKDANTGTVLDSRSLTNFDNGQWLVWNLSGHVTITVTNNGGLNAVISGLFFDAPTGAGAASFVKADATTQGTWTGVYGADGYAIANGTTALPSYVQLSSSGASSWTWQQPSDGDVRTLQTAPGSTSRLAACDVAQNSFSFDLNLTDGQSHQVAIYALNWDSWSYRNETIAVTDAASGAVLDSRSLASFGSGEWLVWNLSGHVKITVTNNGGLNAVTSGIFFGSSPTTAASFVKADAATQGTWTGVYGADGYAIANGTTQLPAYVQLSNSGANTWIWQQPSDGDPRTLQTAPGSTSRLAACDVAPDSFAFDLNLTDGKAHQVALYALNWDSWSYRNETITISDAVTGVMLDTRGVTNFSNGQWIAWNISGHVKITVANNGGLNAVTSGIFFG